jgi:hypothetical protein
MGVDDVAGAAWSGHAAERWAACTEVTATAATVSAYATKNTHTHGPTPPLCLLISTTQLA